MTRRVLVIAPHGDDEVLGAGGTIARLAAEGADVHVVIVTRGLPPLFAEGFADQVEREARDAHEVLGVRDTIFLEFPAAGLDGVPHRELNAALVQCLRTVRPNLLLLPFAGDLHLDHQRVFASALVAARPCGSHAPDRVYAYETLSETNWNAPQSSPVFAPNVFVDISGHLDTKLNAMQRFTTQVHPFPHERSLEALRALAMLRGATVGRTAAEAFVAVREVI
jgi:LmbE family N-acetylglucosaminyl deacetylase